MGFGKKIIKSSKIFHLEYDDSFVDFKDKLKMGTKISVWDIDSTTLAFQLTMLDTQMFLKVGMIRSN